MKRHKRQKKKNNIHWTRKRPFATLNGTNSPCFTFISKVCPVLKDPSGKIFSPISSLMSGPYIYPRQFVFPKQITPLSLYKCERYIISLFITSVCFFFEEFLWIILGTCLWISGSYIALFIGKILIKFYFNTLREVE